MDAIPYLLHGKAVDDASDSDKAWFEAHPDREFRFRHSLPFEFNEKNPIQPEGWINCTLVVQLIRGLRQRHHVPTPIDTPISTLDDAFLEKMFNAVAPEELQLLLVEFRKNRVKDGGEAQ